MCLAIPAHIECINDNRLASVTVLGVAREAALDLVPQAQVGDYVLLHAGYAIEVIDEQLARETLALIAEFPELVDLPEPVDLPAPVGQPTPVYPPAPVGQLAPVDLPA